MKFAIADDNNGHVIQGYAPGKILVDDRYHHGSLVLLSDRIFTEWPPQRFDELKEDDFRFLADLKPEIIVLGTGEKQKFPDPSLYTTVLELGIGMEVMHTPAACRTYNILMGEGRRVAAALLPI